MGTVVSLAVYILFTDEKIGLLSKPSRGSMLHLRCMSFPGICGVLVFLVVALRRREGFFGRSHRMLALVEFEHFFQIDTVGDRHTGITVPLSIFGLVKSSLLQRRLQYKALKLWTRRLWWARFHLRHRWWRRQTLGGMILCWHECVGVKILRSQQARLRTVVVEQGD